MQVSAIPNTVWYVPVQPVPPVGPVVRRDPDADAGDGSRKVRSANPPGVGSRLDIEA